MRDDQALTHIALAALARADEIEALSIAAIEKLIDEAKQRGADGKPTRDAITASAKLASPGLNSTTISVALRDRIKPGLNKAIDQVEKAEVEFSTAVAALRALQARYELFERARGTPQKRVVEEHDLAPEEWKFIREMRARKVPVSAIDQLTEPELDFVATLFIDKQRDMRHRHRAGVWWTLVRAGSLDISSEAFNDEERAAILAARPKDEENARFAYDALCELAGRKLDVPHVFAQFVLAYAEHSSASVPEGAFEKNVERVHAEQVHVDAERLLDILGLPISELRRAFALMRSPALISFTERVARERAAAEQRMDTYRALVDQHRPAARQALEDRHEAERRKERELVGADDLGVFDVETALERLGAYDEMLSVKNASIIRAVRLGTFFEDREAERRRTVDQLASRLIDSPEIRKTVASTGILLPSMAGLDEDQVSEIPAPPIAQIPAAADVSAPDSLVNGTSGTGSLTAGLDLPDDVAPEAAEAYYNIARQYVITVGEWKEATFANAYADRNNPAAVAGMLHRLEEADQRGALDDVCSRYLAIWKSQSLAKADDYLIDLEARKVIREVATGQEFAEHRRQAGFPRPSQ